MGRRAGYPQTSRQSHGDAEAVVGVAELRGNAAAGGAAGHLDVVAPGAAAGGAARAGGWALGIVRWRNGIVKRVVPIAAPFVNVDAHIIEAVAIGLGLGDRFGTVPETVPGNFGKIVAPGVEALLMASARGEFPLGFGR